MGKERQRVRPSALERLRAEIGAADRFITWVTWGCAAGMVLWSMLNATPYVRAHVAKGWEDTAFVLPLVVDAAFVGALRADEIASRHGVKAGPWPVLLRLFTGASSVFLNIGHSAEKGDVTGVLQHLVAPGLLVLLAEAGPAWRRNLAAKLTAAERAAELEEDRQAERARQEAERARRQRQEDEDRQAEKDREEQERQRLERLQDEARTRRQRQEDEQRAAELEETRETARAARALEARRLDLEEKRLTATVPPPPAAPVRAMPAAMPAAAPGVTAGQSQITHGTSAHVAPRVAAPQPTAPRPVPAAVAASHPAPGRVTARVDEDQEQPPTAPKPPAGPVKDWELPGLPTDVRPGVAPIMLTDEQSHIRIRYGLDQGWSQRRIGEFAGRSATTVNKVAKGATSSV
ncbi:DUF2637 domain-containing protein [Streptomyces sp. rh34]|uniref:DUF2637 domain-containing protein n=1 Tax=Streptomyces sp. rh34 TaxID=2034272 RepID=UPI000D1B396E|nr:DUF2637 domain-containing protein [Streptomyces sp. rh34]